ncbi:MAG: universal stress protein, partial [Anaerolineaceae bacterium]
VLEAGPTVGEWRESWQAAFSNEKLFSHILVAIDGQDTGWHALQEATRVAKREKGTILGLHVVDTVKAVNSEMAQAIAAEFKRRCQEVGVLGEIAITTGPVTGTICYRARWADLVVVSLSHPPGPGPVDRLNSQFAQLLRRSPRPILAVPRVDAGLQRLLLAYDGSPKANEALFVARYMVEKWEASFMVVTVKEAKGGGKKTSMRARRYLEEHDIQADYLVKKGDPSTIIVQTARDIDCDLIIMGGYGSNPVSEIVSGSVVDDILRSRNRPVLICR